MEVLIVEDDLIVSRLHKFTIAGAVKDEVRLCQNGRVAIDYLDQKADSKEKFLILLDLNMPEMNGWEFLEACHKRHYSDKLVVVVVTSSPYSEDHERAMEFDRVVGYYTKPLRRENLPVILEHPELSQYAHRT